MGQVQPNFHIPFTMISGLPMQAQVEIRRNFEELVSNMGGGGGGLFNATVDAGLTVSDPATHSYVNFTDLVASETWGASDLFVIGIVGRGNDAVLQTSAVSLPGPTAIVGMGYQGTTGPGGGANSTQSDASPSIDLRGLMTVNGSLTLDNVTVYNNDTSGSITAFFATGGNPYFFRGATISGQSVSGGIAQRCNGINSGGNPKIFAWDTTFISLTPNTGGAGSSFLFDCVYIYGSSTTFSVTGSGVFFWDGGMFGVISPTGPPTMTLGGSKDHFVRLTGSPSTAWGTASGGGASNTDVTVSTTGRAFLHFGSPDSVRFVTVNATAGDTVIEGYCRRLTSSNSALTQRKFNVAVAHQVSGTTDSLNLSGPTQCRATIAATTGTPQVIIGGSKVQAEIEVATTMGNTTGALQLVSATDCFIRMTATGVGGSSKPYAIDAGSARNVVIFTGSLSGFGVAGTNSSTTTLVITETGATPSGTILGDLAGSTWPTLNVANDAITNAKLANMAQATIKGRDLAAGTGDPTDLSPTQVLSVLGDGNYPVRTQLGQWFQDNVAASQTNVALETGIGTAGTRFHHHAIRPGSVTGIVVYTNEARVAGTLTVEVTINGIGTGLTAVLDGTNTGTKASTQALLLDTFVAGDRIGVRLTTDGSWSPTTADITAEVEIVQ